MRADIIDRAKGAFFGLAVGDALGTTLEFTTRDQYTHLTDMVGGGPFNLEIGGWTDDTSMALGLADSLISKNNFDSHDIMSRWYDWYSKGKYSHTGTCFDIGIQTRTALSNWKNTGQLPARTNSAGNGAIMRLAPVVLFTIGHGGDEGNLAVAQAMLTHNNELCASIANEMAKAMMTLILDNNKTTVSPSKYAHRKDVRAGGFVVDSWDAARWAFLSTNSFRDCVLSAANLGEDADTTAAIAGQIAGAYYGKSAIPEKWLKALKWHDVIEDYSNSLLALK